MIKLTRPTLVCATLLSLASLALAFQVTYVPQPLPRPPKAVVSGEVAFVLGEAEKIVGGKVREVLPAPDGPYAFITRELPNDPNRDYLESSDGVLKDGKVQVLLWNRKSGRVSVIWQAECNKTQLVSVSLDTFVYNTTVATATVGRVFLEENGSPRHNANGNLDPGENITLLLDTKVTAPRATIPVANGNFLTAVPHQPYLLLQAQVPPGEKQFTYQMVSLDGKPSPPVSVSSEYHTYGAFSQDGTALYAFKDIGIDETTKRPTRAYFSVRIMDGTITNLSERPKQVYSVYREADQDKRQIPLALETRSVTVKGKTDKGESAEAVYLTATDAGKEDADARIALDARAVTLMPDLSAVLYVNRSGSLFAVPMYKMDIAAYAAAKREAYKKLTMSNAKQIGLGMLMYTQDYDETLPLAEGIQANLDPYLKSAELFHNPATGKDAFTYFRPFPTITNGDLAKVENPANTKIGVLEGPGGRAIIYVDGHVVWEEP